MTLFKTLATLAALIAALYATVPSPSETLRAPNHAVLDATAVAVYPPTYYPGAGDLDLPDGQTHYYMFGPEDGPRIVFVHGFAVPSPVWTQVAHTAASKGYRVLLYDLYGRGYSDSPMTHYTSELYVTQLSQLLKKLSWDREPFTLAGVSMGGAIVTLFTHHFGHLVRELVLVCPAGLMSTDDFPLVGRFIAALPDSVITLMQSKLLKPALFAAVMGHLQSDADSAERIAAYPVETTELVERIAGIIKFQADNHMGYIRGLLSSLSYFPLVGLSSIYEAVGKESARPVLAVWGDADTTVPFKYSQVLKDKIPQAELVVVPGGRHEIAVTDYEVVADAILKFLAKARG